MKTSAHLSAKGWMLVEPARVRSASLPAPAGRRGKKRGEGARWRKIRYQGRAGSRMRRRKKLY